MSRLKTHMSQNILETFASPDASVNRKFNKNVTRARTHSLYCCL